jgi:hypothetical protein
MWSRAWQRTCFLPASHSKSTEFKKSVNRYLSSWDFSQPKYFWLKSVPRTTREHVNVLSTVKLYICRQKNIMHYTDVAQSKRNIKKGKMLFSAAGQPCLLISILTGSNAMALQFGLKIKHSFTRVQLHKTKFMVTRCCTRHNDMLT